MSRNHVYSPIAPTSSQAYPSYLLGFQRVFFMPRTSLSHGPLRKEKERPSVEKVKRASIPSVASFPFFTSHLTTSHHKHFLKTNPPSTPPHHHTTTPPPCVLPPSSHWSISPWGTTCGYTARLGNWCGSETGRSSWPVFPPSCLPLLPPPLPACSLKGSSSRNFPCLLVSHHCYSNLAPH
jgi:hypothetical protein